MKGEAVKMLAGQAWRFCSALQKSADNFGFEDASFKANIDGVERELVPIFALATSMRSSAWACSASGMDCTVAVKVPFTDFSHKEIYIVLFCIE